VSGNKGLGKSTTAIILAREYIDKFGFICPHCNNEFYKNIYSIKKSETNKPIFYIPDYVKEDKAWIQCPIDTEMDLKTGQKKHISGCGKKFLYSQRKKIKWSAEKFVGYNNDDVMRMIYTMPKNSPIIADEAIKFASASDFNKAESKEMKKLFTVIRPKRFWFFFIIPEITWIDSKYREGMSSFWIRMIDRGTAAIFEKDKGVTVDSWHLKEMEKLMGVVKYFTPIDKIKRNVMKHPCYFDMFRFGELDEKIYNEYEMFRNAKNLQQQIKEQQFNQKDYAKLMAYNLIENWDRINLKVRESKEFKMTYSVLCSEILSDPLTRKSVAGDQTVRNWIRGIREYIETRGENVEGFDVTEKPEVAAVVEAKPYFEEKVEL
jgi:DNA polymerase III delta prime subunit